MEGTGMGITPGRKRPLRLKEVSILYLSVCRLYSRGTFEASSVFSRPHVTVVFFSIWLFAFSAFGLTLFLFVFCYVFFAQAARRQGYAEPGSRGMKKGNETVMQKIRCGIFSCLSE
jgi:hypothetical protein